MATAKSSPRESTGRGGNCTVIAPLYILYANFNCMLTFKYHKSIDKRCWHRLILAKSMFGRKFPSAYKITSRNSEEAKSRLSEFSNIWKPVEKQLLKGLAKIYSKAKIPTYINCYLNTSPYSMDDYQKGYISITARLKNPKKIREIITHELAHFLFRQAYAKYALKIGYTKKQLENLKEILTILHKPTLGLNDAGYDIHKTQRTMALKLWEQRNNLEQVIFNLKNII